VDAVGYREEGVLRRRLPASSGAARRDAVIFSLLMEDLASSPAALVRLVAFDCRGLPMTRTPARGATLETG
jgi:hypothetical protein